MSMTTTTTTIQFLDDGEAKPQSVAFIRPSALTTAAAGRMRTALS
ncbi:hypothetical protein WME90_08470 [Sorangium sp. So ce375]|jgi:hypothetical protein